jgi:hypothetical protein
LLPGPDAGWDFPPLNSFCPLAESPCWKGSWILWKRFPFQTEFLWWGPMLKRSCVPFFPRNFSGRRKRFSRGMGSPGGFCITPAGRREWVPRCAWRQRPFLLECSFSSGICPTFPRRWRGRCSLRPVSFPWPRPFVASGAFPVFLPPSLRPKLLGLRGDVGARDLLSECVLVPWEEPGVILDLDRPEDLEVKPS